MYNFTASAEVGGGIITFELDKDNNGARAASNTYGLSGKLKDGSNVVPLTGTFLPGLGVFTASTTSNGKIISIMGTVNAEGKLVNSRAVVYRHNLKKAVSSPVEEGGSAIAGTAVLDPGAFPIPGEYDGIWRFRDVHPDENAAKFGITTKLLNIILISPTASTGGRTFYAEWDGRSLEVMLFRDDGQMISFKKAVGFPDVYDTISSRPNYGARSEEERKESFGAYLDSLVEKGTITEGEKTDYLGWIIYDSEQPQNVFNTNFVESKEEYIRFMEVIGGFCGSNFEADYFIKKGRTSPQVLYERGASWMNPAGEIAMLSFRWGDKEQYTTDLE